MINPSVIKSAQKRLYDSLVAANQLQYFDAIYCLGLPERTIQSKANIVTGLYNATETGTPNFNAGYGYYGDGSSSIFLSLLNPASGGLNYAQNDAHIGFFNRTKGTAQGIELGQYDGVKGSWLASKYSDNKTYLNINGAAGVDFGNLTEIRGWFYGERSNSTQIKLYKDSVLVNTLTSVSVGIANQPFYALATNQSAAVLGTSQSSKKIGLVHVGKSGMNIPVVYAIFNQFFIDLEYPLKTAYGIGDSLMFGFNASTQDASFFNKLCVNKHYDWVNSGVSGTALVLGGRQIGYNTANIPTKTSYDQKLIVNFGLNDAYNIYYLIPDYNLAAVNSAAQAFITAAISKGWSVSDIIWITDFQVGSNIYYSAAQYANVTNEIKTVCLSNGVSYISITNAPVYVTSDGVHPASDADYKIIADYIISQRNLFL